MNRGKSNEGKKPQLKTLRFFPSRSEAELELAGF